MTVHMISPTPTQGGTIIVTPQTVAWVYLGNNKFMIFYRQTTPSYIVAHIVTCDGLSAPTIGQTYEIRASYSTSGYYRAFKVSASKVLLFFASSDSTNETGLQMQFISFDESDNITTASSLISLASLYVALSTIYSYSFCAEQIDDTHILISYATDTGLTPTKYTCHFARLMTVIPDTNTYTLATRIMSEQPLASESIYNGFYANKIANSPSVMWYGYTYRASASTPSNKLCRIATSAGASSYNCGIVDVNHLKKPVVLSLDTYVNIYTLPTVTAINESNTITGETYGTLAGSYGLSSVDLSFPIDKHYFMALTLGETSVHAMVYRRLAKGFYQIAPATNIANGLQLDMGGITSGMSHFVMENSFVRQPAH